MLWDEMRWEWENTIILLCWFWDPCSQNLLDLKHSLFVSLILLTFIACFSLILCLWSATLVSSSEEYRYCSSDPLIKFQCSPSFIVNFVSFVELPSGKNLFFTQIFVCHSFGHSCKIISYFGLFFLANLHLTQSPGRPLLRRHCSTTLIVLVLFFFETKCLLAIFTFPHFKVYYSRRAQP